MSFVDCILLAISAATFIYLAVAMFRPERF
jgi:K+-transporting ATPase KdpF subunit